MWSLVSSRDGEGFLKLCCATWLGGAGAEAEQKSAQRADVMAHKFSFAYHILHLSSSV